MSAIAHLVRGITASRFTGSDAGDREFLQRRCAFFGRAVFLFGIAGYLLSMGIFVARAGSLESWLEKSQSALGMLGPGLALAYWLTMRRGSFSHTALNLGDAAITILLCAVTAYRQRVSDSFIAPGAVMASFAALISFRAVVIPSSGMRTTVIGCLSAVPVILYVIFPGEWVAAYEAQAPENLAETRAFFSPWIIIGIAISTVASNVIYGLRKQVAQAQRLGQYQLEERLGGGGMGEVYRASHAMLRRPTAVKLIRPDVAGEEAIRRFENEVQTTASLTHPNTVAIYDYGRTPDGVFYYAMELLEGYDLQTLVERFGVLSPSRVIHILIQACGSLEEAHATGLVHRDIKPANMVLTRRGGRDDVLKVVDFGLVKLVEQEADVQITAPDTIMGTPQYIAPETIRDASNTSPAIDVYALGAVGFYLLAGSPVFRSTSVMAICAQHLEQKPDRPSERLGSPLPQDLEDLILRCLSKARVERPTVGELAEALGNCRDAGQWTAADAADWWAAHPLPERTAAAAESSGDSSEFHMTFQVEAASRIGAAPE